MVWFKEDCPSHRIDCPLERKPGGGTQTEENRCETLRADCVEKGGICRVIPTEVGCLGFLGHSVISFLSKIGITGCSLKVTSYRLQTTVQYASSWIWSRAKSLQHEWNAREITITVWLVTSRNSYCECIRISTAKSKRVLKITNSTKNKDECIV